MSGLGRRLPFSLTFALLCACGSDDGPSADNMGPECGYHSDCEGGGVCTAGKCQGTTTCLDRLDCTKLPLCQDHSCICPSAGPQENRCTPVCATDNDCPADGECLDGICQQYELDWSLPGPQLGEKHPLEVGIAVASFDYPMGVSLAGYGARSGAKTPYQDALGGSDAWFERLDVRAIAFSDGEETFVLLRIPMGWSTDYMLTETARKVHALTGINLIDHIITSANHSHAEPARFWHMVQGLYFGSFGYDEFLYEVFDRLTTSFANATVMALDDMQPAKFGYKVIDDFDPDNKIHRDRREQNDNLPGYFGKDDRMVVMRIDDMQGQPLAVLTHFGIHGTVFGHRNPIVTGDAPGGIEVALTEGVQKKYQRPVLGMFVQGNGGDISPAGDDMGHDELEIVQLIGARTWRVIEPVLDEIETSADIDVSMFSGRIAMDHDVLYGPGEFHDPGTQCEGSPDYFRFGAFQCVNTTYKDDDPDTHYSDGDLACIFSVECLTGGYAIPQIQKTRLSVARLGSLGIATMPGEPNSQFGRDLSDRMVETIDGVTAAITAGYSQDHQFYLMHEEDWFQGGYEPSYGLWGWKFAPYLADKSVEIAAQLNNAPAERTWDNQNIKPMYWNLTDEEKKPIEQTETEGAPDEVLGDVPATVKRLQVVTFSWAGGHPGVDLPVITLEKEGAEGFSPVLREGGRVYTDSDFEMLVRYVGDCNRATCTDHAWEVSWEERRDFPTGTYRLSATGKALKGGEVIEYTATSQPFAMVPTDELSIYDLTVNGTAIEGRVVDPAAIVVEETDGVREVKTVGHLLRSESVPRNVGAPLPEGMTLTAEGTIRLPSGDVVPVDAQLTAQRIVEARTKLVGFSVEGQPEYENAGRRDTTRFELSSTAMANGPAGDYELTLKLVDIHGNSGEITTTITK